jgi:hypothetical protein
MKSLATLLLFLAGAAPALPAQSIGLADVERVTTLAPFPRGLAMVGGDLIVLCRGRVRGSGGVSSEVEDQAGTLYRVNPAIGQPLAETGISEAVKQNGRLLARPASPPFRLWDRSSNPPQADRETDRPYCSLRYHEPTQSLYLCAFSGVDLQPGKGPKGVRFSKNLSDALLRYDFRTESWHEVERHGTWAGGSYPHHDVRHNPPPHGWLNGPDNCLPLGQQLYAVAKDNSLLVRYDLTDLAEDPLAPPPPSEKILGPDTPLAGGGIATFYGHSALAFHDGWLYVGTRTSSVIFRVRLDENFLPAQPLAVEPVARFLPYDPQSGKSAELTDMGFDEKGRLYVISAEPARVFRFTPNPKNIFDGRTAPAWADLAALTQNPKMKSENVLYHDGWVYVTSGDGYGYQAGADGTVYKLRVLD